MRLVILAKGRKVPVGSTSPSGKSKKIAEGKWVRVSASRKNLPKRVSKQFTIPPAWKDVHYFSDPKAKLLVKGTDAAGRVQYLYNPEHVTKKSAEKFARINDMNKQYDAISVENAFNASKGVKAAQCLALIMDTGIRPGSEKDTKAKVDAYGASTLEGRHVKIQGDSVMLEFVGKKGIPLTISINNPGVAKMIIRSKRAAGNKGKLFGVTGDQLRLYTLKLGDNAGFTTKEFRTHLGTTLAMKTKKKIKKPGTMKEYKAAVKKIAEAVATQLGNTPRVVLQSYINPAIFEKWRSAVEMST